MTPKTTEAMKPCPNHSRYTEGCTACFVEAGTSMGDARGSSCFVAHPIPVSQKQDGKGGIEIKIGDWTYVHIHYDYRYTDNATRSWLAREVVKLISDDTRTPDIERDAEAGAMREALEQIMAWECGASPTYLCAKAALASTAGEGILEKLAKAEEELIKVRRERNEFGEQLGTFKSSVADWSSENDKLRDQLAAVTAERDEVKAQFEQYAGWSRWKPGIWRISFPESGPSAEFIANDVPAQSEIAALRKAILDAPHGPRCLSENTMLGRPRIPFDRTLCDCWKASALKGAE